MIPQIKKNVKHLYKKHKKVLKIWYNKNMVNLITTDSYFNIFNLLVKSLKERGKGIEQKNIVFCEEKVSLMIERLISYEQGGTFNTEVYSFGNFLRTKKPLENLLTIEGSSMAVKKILSSVNLNCFKASKSTIAPTLYNLIIQLKSAKVSPQDILNAIDGTTGVLKNKLIDIYEIFSAYENFTLSNGFIDQSTYLDFLTEVIRDDERLDGANVYLVGFNGFTAQIRQAVESLLDRTNNLTAILCQGDNPLVFVNESPTFIKNLCKEKGVPLLEKHIESEYNKSTKIILDNLFNPFGKKPDQKEDANVFVLPAHNPVLEVERVAEIIKSKVLSGECKYKDMTVAVPDSTYYFYIENAFNNLEIPYFIDQRKKVQHHPLVKLVLSFIEVLRKNFQRNALLSFVKNPYFSLDTALNDEFENYLIKYNINFNKIKKPFTLSEKGENLERLNELREKIVEIFNDFDILSLFEKLNVKEKTENFTNLLFDQNEKEESAINAQMYDATIKLLNQMKLLLGDIRLSLNEYKNVFISGISSLELSIIPQFNDAVFIGDYKETALAKTKHLFALGLTSEVPNVQKDVSLLSDDDIKALENIELLVEPKINVVNHRNREYFALAITAFSKSLYLSYPICTVDGTKTVKSEIFDTINNFINFKDFPKANGYLTKKQGLKTFAKDCGEFLGGKNVEFTNACSYYTAVDDDKTKCLTERANSEIIKQLSSSKEVLLDKVVSPTTIEDYYKCPYMCFMSHALRLKGRKRGEVDVLSVGNLMHEIFSLYTLNVDSVNDEQSSNQLFDSITLKILERDEYKRFMQDESSKMTVDRVLAECKKYCYKTFLSLKNSDFKVEKSEVSFGENCYYPAIELLDGQVKIKGKIDRVDESEKYFRVIDYKTGGTDSSEKSLFAGVKLQLYLYSASVAKKHGNAKSPAGLYYLPVSDKYLNPDEKTGAMADGKTLNDINAVVAQEKDFFSNGESKFMPISLNAKGGIKNGLEKDELSQYINYALSISELAVKQLRDGVIVPSPYEKTCDYCEYKGICHQSKNGARTLNSVKKETIINAPKGKD